jgi:hypothetical protein
MSNELAPIDVQVPTVDGFDLGEVNERVIRGKILKQVDGRNTVDALPFPDDRPLIVQDIAKVAQYWKDGLPLESVFVGPDQPVDIDQLNSNIPAEEWEIGLDGAPRAPWQMNHVVYLFDERDGSSYTMLNSTIGMRIAYENLRDKVKMMRALRKTRVTPVVTIGSTIMKTKFGAKARPEFDIIGWKGLADEQPLLKTIAPPTAAEIVDDKIPEFAAPRRRNTASLRAEKKALAGRAGAIERAPWDDDLPDNF